MVFWSGKFRLDKEYLSCNINYCHGVLIFSQRQLFLKRIILKGLSVLTKAMHFGNSFGFLSNFAKMYFLSQK